MDSLGAYIPMDRRQAMALSDELPDQTHGAALFTDVSGFIPLTEALVMELGPRRGAFELTRQLNAVYSALIAEVHLYHGSVIGFSGDAITCWFDDSPSSRPAEKGQASLRATACALAMQAVMKQFTRITTPAGIMVSLAVKAAIATGPVRHFRVGDPQIQYIDVLAGKTLDRMATAEQYTQKGEVVLDLETFNSIGDKIVAAAWRKAATKDATGQHFVIASGLQEQVKTTPWQPLSAKSLTEEQIRPWLLPPVYERLKAGSGRFLTEIRPAVALFLKFGRLDYDQDEAAGTKLDAYIRLVQNILAYYEGYLIQLTIGDKGSYLYAAFGAPLAHDDDPTRAVAAALELRSPPAELNFTGGIQIGISQGRLRAGAYGSTARRTYGVLGDEVNIAARLMQQAKPGQIIVSQRIVDAIGNDYRLEYLGLVIIRGKQEAVPVSTVISRRMPSLLGLVGRFATPLLNRDGELARLEQLLDAIVENKGRILCLEGAGGIGKSHLMAEFAARAIHRGVRVIPGVCQSTSQNIAYYPWRQVFRALLVLTDEIYGNDQETLTARQIGQVEEIVRQTNPGWQLRLPLLGELLGLPISHNSTTAAFDPQLRQEALIALAVEMIQIWAKAQPLVLLIEDAHWLDEASLRLAVALGRIITNMPVLLVLVQRPRDQSLFPDLNRLPEYQHLILGELSAQGVTGLVTNRLQGKFSHLALALIQNLVQGNPFFTEELVDTLRQSGHLYRENGGPWTLSARLFKALQEANCLVKNKGGEWALAPDASLSGVELDIPDSIYGLVWSRLDYLPETTKMTLKVASVIGRTVEFDLLAQSHPTRPDQAALLEQFRELETYDLLRLVTSSARLTYTFKHHLIQEAIYETMTQNQQRELHRVVAESLAQIRPESVESLAYHYQQGGVRDQALFYLDQAAHKAQREYANETALNYYNQALALEERWDRRRGQVEVLHILGRREEEAAGLQLLAASPDAPAFEVAYWHGQYHESIGNYVYAQTAVEQALAASRQQGNLEGEVRGLAQLGLINYRQGDYEQSKVRYNQALDLFEPEATYGKDLTRAFVQVFNGLGIVHHQLGEFEPAQICYRRALALSRLGNDRRGEANTLNSLGATTFNQRRFTEARAFHQQALDIQRTIGDRVGEGTSLYNLAQITCDTGEYSQAQEYLSGALKILQATGNRWQEINIWNDMGILYHELGNLTTAQNCLEQGLQLMKEIGAEERMASYLLSNLGLVMRDQGDLAAAERVLSQGLALVQAANNKHQEVYFLSYLGTVNLQRENLEQATMEAQAAVKLWEELSLSVRKIDDMATLAAAHLAAGELANASKYADQVLMLLEECGGEGPEFPQRDYYICYEVLTMTGRETEAHTALQSAYSLIEARAQKITDLALRQSFLNQVGINRKIAEEYKRQTIRNANREI